MKTKKLVLTKALLCFILLSISQMATAQITATTVKKTFNRTTTVSTVINADPTVVWELLTNAENYPTWNSTVVSINGKIEKGEKIKLKSTLDTSRTFKLKVIEVSPNKTLIWGDAMGKRTFELVQTDAGVMFTMTEKIGSFMFPLFASKIPSFDESFEQFASDLKTAAEK